MTRNIVMPLS